MNLSDDDFLKFYCASAEAVFNNIGAKKEVILIKDLNHHFCFISSGYYARQIVLDEKKSEVTRAENVQKFHDETRAEDELIISNCETLISLFVDAYYQMDIIRKSPIINPSTGNVVGILGRIYQFVMPNILDILYQINDIPPLELADDAEYKDLHYELTERQHMVLFLSVYKYSPTSVSEIMTRLGQKLSSGRVKEHLENLKYIFAVKSKEELIKKALRLKYHLFIPRKFLKVGSHILIDDGVLISEL